MVSPTSTTSQTPPLSYAESAKKAQGAKLASQHTQKPLSVPPRQPPAPVLESKRTGPSPPTVETTLTSLADDGSPSGANPPVPTSPGESTSHTTTITIDTAHTGILPSTSTKAVPTPNVWNQRIQQRAQTRPQPRLPQSLPHMTQSHVLRVPSPTRNPSSTSSGSRQPDVPVSASIRSDQIPSSPSGLNGASVASSTSSPSTGTTPSSRREPLPHPPPVDDAESWPEVGKIQTSGGKSQRVGNGYAGSVEAKDVEEKDTDGPSQSHPGTPRKSEKTKWIVIPPEELQATADSLNPPRSYAQSRSHSQLGSRNSQARNAAASSSGSMQGSQAPSKTASGRTSTSHSRAHSPSSMASSPQHPGRGRQLPVDIRGPQAPEQQHQQQQQSSQGNSPRAYADMALSPVHYGQIARDVYPYGNLPSQSAATQPYIPQQPPAPAQPPLSTHYPPALQLNPTHSQQPYTSSSVSPYPQTYPLHTPSDRYGPAPTQPLPPGWAAPEHYVYPYGYPPYAQPHPIMYWPNNLPLDVRQDGRTMYPSYPPVQPPQQIVPPPHVSEDDGAPSGGEEPATHPALPPPTMIVRPPPPQDSDAVAGYRAVKSILDAGSDREESTRGRRDMIFGSVGAPGGCKSPSPPPQPSSEAQPAAIDSQLVNEKPERAVATFSIGVSPGEAGPSHVRSRARSQPQLSRTENLSDGMSLEPHMAAEVKAVDLTSPETKWEFGTANRPQDEYTQDDKSRPEFPEPQAFPHAPPAPSKASLDVSLLFNGPLQESLLPIVPAEPSLAELHHPYPQPHHHLSYVLPQHMHVPPPPPSQEELQVQTGPGPYPVHQPPPQPPSGSSADGFEVKDYGYGFGRASGTGQAIMSTREERQVREREWERNRDPEREPYTWRPRRGSYSGHHERGGYGGRRGRANGFGRGISGRGFGRGGFGHQHRNRHQHQQHQQQHQHQHQQQHQQPQPQPHAPQQQHQQQAPPFTATPPTQAFQPLQPSTSPPRSAAEYLATPIQQPYLPQGFDAYQAPVPLSYPPPPNASMTSSVSVHPVPRPLSNITYSADPTRFFLLGQLEYYLSAQNMASDLFLRQRMDSRGWIPVSLLASFNRVRQLTLDPQLVRDVLTLSSIVELRDDCVRMGGGEWRRFVLPDAPTSTVEFDAEAEGEQENRLGVGVDREQYDPEDHDHVEDYVEEEEEEEEIEIVMDRELGQPWATPSSS
ncbi:hypothetical protein EDB89DRAFT_2067268 [Lactarius sanguifluus]|nr:hypothetical protein EDB89DRAFT_2067268 [Lactarius sanguifluus]